MSHAHPQTPGDVPAGIAADNQTSAASVVQMHGEMNELRAMLAQSREENALLNEVISTICSTLKLDEVLHHLVDTIARAISCHAAFIYLYNKEKDRLILASTSEQYQDQVGKSNWPRAKGSQAGWL